MFSIEDYRNNLLKYIEENSIIDLTYVQEKMEMQEREEILRKHPYAIWEDKGGIWHTYLPDKEKGRISRKRKSKEEIESVVIQYWREQDETVKTLFDEWMATKLQRGEISEATRDRYSRQFEQCFGDFANRNVKSISEYDIEEFILNTIHECELTQKGFSNFRTLIYGIFRLAKKKKKVLYSISQVLEDMEISRKSFRKVEKSDDEQVFMVDELPRVIEYLEENLDMVNLGLLLIFKTGLRVGELAGLKNVDVKNGVIHVNRTEISHKGSDGAMVYEVRDFPKTDAGIREVILPDNYEWILRKIRVLNPFGEYLFEKDGERIRTYVFRNRLYTVCKKAEAKRKSPHKARKTYGSILIDSGVPESTVINQMGHTDIKTTKQHYYKNRRSVVQIKDEINKVEGL